MRTQSICITLAIALLCPFASAQWVHTTLPDSLAVSCFAVSGTDVFAGNGNAMSGSGGVFRSSNNGTSWAATSLTNGVSCFVVGGTNLFAGTDGHGIWRRPLSEMDPTSAGTTADNLPSTFILYQNFPNPFNPSTTIKFELPRASVVSLAVYDVLGREVSVLINDRRSAGVYEVKFDGSALASGVYFYRLQAGSYVNRKKLLLLR